MDHWGDLISVILVHWHLRFNLTPEAYKLFTNSTSSNWPFLLCYTMNKENTLEDFRWWRRRDKPPWEISRSSPGRSRRKPGRCVSNTGKLVRGRDSVCRYVQWWERGRDYRVRDMCFRCECFGYRLSNLKKRTPYVFSLSPCLVSVSPWTHQIAISHMHAHSELAYPIVLCSW